MNIGKQIVFGSGYVLTALALLELYSRHLEKKRLGVGGNYWRRYHDPEVLEHSDRLRQVETIRSVGTTVHIDFYAQPDPQAPVVIFNHGGAGYARLFVPLALRFYNQGYTVVLPDQVGQGFSGGARGDYTIAECTQTIVDVAFWARARFEGAIFLAGGSVGGALSYYAAAAGAPVSAIACLNLFDFGTSDGLELSRLATILKGSYGLQAARLSLSLLQVIEWLRIPAQWLARFDKLMDERDAEFQRQWQADPIPPRRLSLRQIASNITTPPARLFEANQIPVLVINQRRDQMISPEITRRNFERLSGPKRYIELDYGHWSNDPDFWDQIVDASTDWFSYVATTIR